MVARPRGERRRARGGAAARRWRGAQAEHGAKPLQARLWLQECCSLAYACQVVASSSASWTMLGPDGTRLSEVPSLVGLVRAMLEGDDAAGAEAAEPAKAEGPKKRKKRKST